MRPSIGDEEFIELYRTKGPTYLAGLIGIRERNIQARRQRLEQKFGIEIRPVHRSAPNKIPAPRAVWRLETEFVAGTVIIASDFHYWPDQIPFMHKVLVRFIKDLKPRIVVLNGDVMDFPKISRFPAINADYQPEVKEEIEFAQEMTHEIASACPAGCHKIWTMGNHDERFPIRATAAGLGGLQLKDYFPVWEPCYQVVLNPVAGHEAVLIHHRQRGGKHAVTNNLEEAGCHTVTGHLHRAEVRAKTYFMGRTIWGIDTGCVAEPDARAFEYTRGAPTGWREGFGVLTFSNGRLLVPELVTRWDKKRVQWRGQLVGA